jgi:cytidylate kinase
VSPSVPAADAVVIDTSNLGIDAVLARVVAEVRQVLPAVLLPEVVPKPEPDGV